jgi:hypothetical protein
MGWLSTSTQKMPWMIADHPAFNMQCVYILQNHAASFRFKEALIYPPVCGFSAGAFEVMGVPAVSLGRLSGASGFF